MQAPDGNAARRRALIMKILVRPGERRHPLFWAGVRSAIGIVVIIIGVTLCLTGFWWGALLILVGALVLVLAALMLALLSPEA
jgi:hypothetical protein